MKEKKRVQPNQPVEMTIHDLMLSEAMAEHFSTENCDGVLNSTVISYHMCQFECRKCSRVFQMDLSDLE